jgi:hypothetical protein
MDQQSRPTANEVSGLAGLRSLLEHVRVVRFELLCLAGDFVGVFQELGDSSIIYVRPRDETRFALAVNQSLRSAFRGLAQFGALVVLPDLDLQILFELVADLQLTRFVIFFFCFFSLLFGLVV